MAGGKDRRLASINLTALRGVVIPSLTGINPHQPQRQDEQRITSKGRGYEKRKGFQRKRKLLRRDL